MHFIGVSVNKLFNTCIHHSFHGYFCHSKQLFHHLSCMKPFTYDFCEAFEILLTENYWDQYHLFK